MPIERRLLQLSTVLFLGLLFDAEWWHENELEANRRCGEWLRSVP